ncbi:MAG TPA: hypothetical protein VN671_00200 [Solirubrobacterales bacterium]|nr:hypothetical protein [Solirubrobacterales bacterium]
MALVLVIAPAAADGAAAKGRVWMTRDPYCGGLHLAQRPSGFALTCDPVAFVEKVKWSSWGGGQAKATGVLNVAELKNAPNVAEAPRVTYAANIVASRPIVCGAHRVYKRVVVHYVNAGRPEKTELPPPLCPE